MRRTLVRSDYILSFYRSVDSVAWGHAPGHLATLSFWAASLSSLQQVLEAFGNDLKESELRVLAHPHPISGPMDFQQRLEFLRFHLNRHEAQPTALMEEMKK